MSDSSSPDGFDNWPPSFLDGFELAPINEISPNKDTLGKFVSDPEYTIQQKLDGDRILVDLSANGYRIYNKKIQEYKRREFPESLIDDFNRAAIDIKGRVLLDGELIGDTYHVFDIPLAQKAIGEKWSWANWKWDRRMNFYPAFVRTHFTKIHTVPIAQTRGEKIGLILDLMTNGGEGYIVRHKQWDDVLKVKFVNEVDCVVLYKTGNSKDSVAVGLKKKWGASNAESFEEVCNVSTLHKPPVKTHDVVTVRYLYATENQRLVQPRIVKIRTDKDKNECTFDQYLRYKSDRIVSAEDILAYAKADSNEH